MGERIEELAADEKRFGEDLMPQSQQVKQVTRTVLFTSSCNCAALSVPLRYRRQSEHQDARVGSWSSRHFSRRVVLGSVAFRFRRHLGHRSLFPPLQEFQPDAWDGIQWQRHYPCYPAEVNS